MKYWIFSTTLLCFLWTPGIAYATLSSCGGTLGSYGAGNNPPGGCGANDLGFNSFQLGGGATNLNGIVLSAPAVTPTSTTIPQIVNDFAGDTDWTSSSPGTTTFTLNYLTQVIGAGAGGSSPAAPFSTWGITTLGLNVGTNNFNAVGDSIEIKEYFCQNTAAICSAGTSSGFMDEIVSGTGQSLQTETELWTVCTPNAGGSGC